MNYYLVAGTALVFFATVLGAFPLLLFGGIRPRFESGLLGLSAGVMLGATFFSLLMPGLDEFQKMGQSPFMSSIWVSVGLMAGAALLLGFHKIVPHEHLLKSEDQHFSRLISQQWLLILAVGLHNLPEGIAVGVGIGSGDVKLGTTLAIAIAFQDFPEGWIVAAGLHSLGMKFPKVLFITALTAIVESVGVLIGYFALQYAAAFLPIAFSLCAGAMLFVVSHEIIPESHRKGYELDATWGLLGGFALMMILDLGLSSWIV